MRTLVTVIHTHHLVEDELTFPQARTRIPNAPYDMLSAQHQAMIPILEEVEATIKETAALPQVSVPIYSMHETLKKVSEIWHPHIRIEEEHFTPATVAGLYAVDEQAKISASIAEHSKEHATPDYLVIPFVGLICRYPHRNYRTAELDVIQNLLDQTGSDRGERKERGNEPICDVPCQRYW